MIGGAGIVASVGLCNVHRIDNGIVKSVCARYCRPYSRERQAELIT